MTTTVRGTDRACDATNSAITVRHLSSSHGSVWVWIESAARSSFRAGELVKVVWRITGRGTPRAVLTDPVGEPQRLSFGPERHASSTFRHPGEEYGTGFRPTTSGCWRLTMQRGNVAGAISFEVVR